MSAYQTIRIAAATTFRATTTLKDYAGDPIPLASLVSVKRTTYNASSATPVETDVDCMVPGSPGWCVIGATAGDLTWYGQGPAAALVDATADVEEHVAEFTVSWDAAGAGGTKVSKELFRIIVQPSYGRFTLCTFDDVVKGFGVIQVADQPFVEDLIDAVTLAFEREAHRKFKYLDQWSEVLSNNQAGAQKQLLRFPIDMTRPFTIKEAWDSNFAGPFATTVAASDYVVNDKKGRITHKYAGFYTIGQSVLEMTYSGGIARDVGGVPRDLRMAATRQVIFWWQNRTKIGISSMTIPEGGMIQQLATQDLLPDVVRTLKRFARIDPFF